MKRQALPPFHLAIPVHDLDAARTFYGELLGCEEGRSAALWVDFNLYGHQLVCHKLASAKRGVAVEGSNPVDGDKVPVPHFGVVLEQAEWRDLADRLRDSGIRFLIEPRTRFVGEPGEQGTMFCCDPSGNVLEFKTFLDIETQLFAH